MKKTRASTEFGWLCDLPRGDWAFGVVTFVDKPDVIVLTDRTGLEPPRMIIDGKVREIG